MQSEATAPRRRAALSTELAVSGAEDERITWKLKEAREASAGCRAVVLRMTRAGKRRTERGSGKWRTAHLRASLCMKYRKGRVRIGWRVERILGRRYGERAVTNQQPGAAKMMEGARLTTQEGVGVETGEGEAVGAEAVGEGAILRPVASDEVDSAAPATMKKRRQGCMKGPDRPEKQ